MERGIRLRLENESKTRERLLKLEQKIQEPAFFVATRSTNTVNYWVFDYNPEQELLVRKFVAELKKTYEKRKYDSELYVIDLYELLIKHLQKRGYLEKCKQFEARRGLDYLTRAIKNSLQLTGNSNHNTIVQYIIQAVPVKEKQIVFLTGVGKCFPFLQGAEVLRQILFNLPDDYRSMPIILFYPGTYTEQELIAFNQFTEDNYYRAFRIVR